MSQRAPLWPQPIPIIGGTGPKWSGKTKFGLNICPGQHTTLVYDFEQSSASYESEYARIGMPFDRVDVQSEMHNYKDEKGNYPYRGGYKAIDVFLWWRKHIYAIETGKYQVIMVDPVTDLERGITDWVQANPKFFGHTDGQYARASGIMWGDLKDYEKQLLADITAKCQTFFFTAHLGLEFKGGSPTGREKAKGKETLYELSSLYLWFDRSPDSKGARANVPSAKVEKSRLEIAEVIDGEIVSYSVLPPRLPVATPKAIRDYFKAPTGKKPLSDAERSKEEKLSADDRLRLEVIKAEAERDAAQARAGTPAPAPQTHTTDTAATAPAPVVVDGGAEGLPEVWERNFVLALDTAATIAELNALPPQIKTARELCHIDDEHVDRLRERYKTRYKQIQPQ